MAVTYDRLIDRTDLAMSAQSMLPTANMTKCVSQLKKQQLLTRSGRVNCLNQCNTGKKAPSETETPHGVPVLLFVGTTAQPVGPLFEGVPATDTSHCHQAVYLPGHRLPQHHHERLGQVRQVHSITRGLGLRQSALISRRLVTSIL